ncbi:MAG: hypothetical protein KTR28_03180 [Micavibrio sp.]|nr:hypothetical protein [Micavibrio sp.]
MLNNKTILGVLAILAISTPAMAAENMLPTTTDEARNAPYMYENATPVISAESEVTGTENFSPSEIEPAAGEVDTFVDPNKEHAKSTLPTTTDEARNAPY